MSSFGGGCGCGGIFVPGYPNAWGDYLSGNATCKPHFPSVAKNFVAPAVDVTAQVQVTDTSMLHVGEGIKIGGGFYQIIDIISANLISIQQSGLGIPAGTLVIARNTESTCYQFPIIPVGLVVINDSPSIVTLDSDGASVISGAATFTRVKGQYGYVGPEHIHIDYQYTGVSAAPYTYTAIELPVPHAAGEDFIGAVNVKAGGGYLAGVGRYMSGAYTQYLGLSASNEGAFAGSVVVDFKVSGIYRIL